jgi:hypothetical protein
MDFLQGSQTYPLEAALEVAQQRNLIDEQVGFVGRVCVWAGGGDEGGGVVLSDVVWHAFAIEAALEVAQQRDLIDEQVWGYRVLGCPGERGSRRGREGGRGSVEWCGVVGGTHWRLH